MTADVPMTPLVGLPATLRAEFAVWRRSAVAHLPLGGLAFALADCAMFLATGSGKTWKDVLGYQNLWAMFVGPMLTVLLAVAAARIDRGARGGGTWYRPVPPGYRHLSRFTALAVRSLLLNVLGAGTPLLLLGLLSSAQRVPAGRAIEAVLIPWISQLGLLALTLWLARQLHAGAALAAGFVWTVLGVVEAESAAWAVLPFTWLDRGALPVLGTHANGVALETHSALAGASPWPPALLGALLAIPFLLLPRLSLSGTRTAKHRTTAERPTFSPGATAILKTVTEPAPRPAPAKPRLLGAVLGILRGTALTWLCPGAVALVALWLSWHDPETSIQLFTLLILPIGTLVLGLTVWSAAAQGWRAVASRATGTTGPALALTAVTVAIAVAVSLITALLYLTAGIPAGHAWPLALTSATVGAMLTTLTLWLAIRTSQAVAAVVGILGIVFGVLVGGTSMQQTLWPLIPYSWANYLDLHRMSVTLPVSLAALALFTYGITHATRKAAENS
ncbi:hypothetical protein [Streptomyces sp. MUSC 14]|uniref:hypothetical protein n=1 Tax=Streptomyces sp. MUSC 14 TaxID=1354889 RepID=UPI001160550C|nr:hypothetical protein [Streptomyces sp. MUSC 14]